MITIHSVMLTYIFRWVDSLLAGYATQLVMCVSLISLLLFYLSLLLPMSTHVYTSKITHETEVILYMHVCGMSVYVNM